MNRTLIIAEAGVNHNGSIEKALELVEAAAAAGADVVKFQTFSAEELVTKGAIKAEYQIKNSGAEENQFEMLKKLELSKDSHEKIIKHCEKLKIQFMSTPFDTVSANFLNQQLNLSIMKISSGDLTNALLLLRVSQSKKPIILSTGMATLSEVEDALKIISYGYISGILPNSSKDFDKAYISKEGQAALKENVTLLHCTTEYPCPVNEVNLNNMYTLKNAFGLKVGYSDHTTGIAIPIAAVAMGATVIEKHFTISRNLPGPDHKASLEPNELKEMVRSIREVEQSLGEFRKLPTESELLNTGVARRSIVASKLIRSGEVLTIDNLTTKRPLNGESAIHYWDYIGRVSDKEYLPDQPVIL